MHEQRSKLLKTAFKSRWSSAETGNYLALQWSAVIAFRLQKSDSVFGKTDR
jgi:hypothetical protein